MRLKCGPIVHKSPPLRSRPSVSKLRSRNRQYDLINVAIGWSGMGGWKPTAASEIYQTRIVCTRQQPRPRVFITAPTLVERNEESIPHRYDDSSLCLWQPAYREWQPAYWIADAVIGWTSLWLFFYELWHACGEWLGGGEHPPCQPVRVFRTES